MNILLLIQIFSCWFMTGVIWIVQVLIYPNFRIVGSEHFKTFHEFHTKRITWIVAPMMGVELFSAIWLTATDFSNFYLFNLASVVSIWILTAFVNIPSHNKLDSEKVDTLNRLTRMNWPRTLIWTLRSGIFCWLLFTMKLQG